MLLLKPVLLSEREDEESKKYRQLPLTSP